MTLQDLQALDEAWVMPTYKRLPVEFVRGEGPHLWDADGKRYLDFLTGISVSSVGHCHPAVVEAVRDQAGRLMHTTNLYLTEPPMRLAERLAMSSLGGRVFFCNSGAEANECAIKLVRKHAHARGIQRPEIVVLDHAFHGRTIATLAGTPQLAREDLFGPLPEGFVVVPRDDPFALEAAVGDSTAAVFIEPVQGECGVHPISCEMLEAARAACNRTGALLAFDEIQTGLGRTGRFWAYQGLGVTPDLLTSAKALGGGMPIGACVTSPELRDVFEPGDHGSTFAGGPVVAAAALAVLDVLDDEALLTRVRELGEKLGERLRACSGVAEVRQRGLMVGIDLSGGRAPDVVLAALEAGLVVNATGPATIRLLPPLVITPEQIDEGFELLAPLL